jgi:hypothetical protein
MALQLGVIHVGATTAADAAVPAVRAASARPTAAWGRPKATDGPVANGRRVPSCGPAGGRDAGSEPWPPGPRGATGGTASLVASRVSIEMHRLPSGADRDTVPARLAGSPTVVS